MKTRTLVLALCATLTASLGCNLSDPNPPQEAQDTGSGGGEDTGGGEDAGVEDTGVEDTGVEDAGEDVGPGDAGQDVGEDMGVDAGRDPNARAVFDEEFVRAEFANFGGSNNDVAPTTEEAATGDTSLKVVVPATGYTGGALVSPSAEDLSEYDALRFSVKASKAATIDTIGFGNDTSTELFQVAVKGGLAVTTEWAEVTIPLPDKDKFTTSSGLFFFAEGSDEGAYDLFFDDITYVKLDPGVAVPGPATIEGGTQALDLNDTRFLAKTDYQVTVLGVPLTLELGPAIMAWASSDTSVVQVDSVGEVRGVGEGRSVITATLDGRDALGELTLEVTEIVSPTSAAPPPAQAAADIVYMLYSDALPSVPRHPVDTFRTFWSNATLTEVQLGNGNNALRYTASTFAGIEFFDSAEGSLDLGERGASTLHMDIWTPNAVLVAIELVSFGPNDVFGPDNPNDDSKATVSLTPTSSPSLPQGRWVTLDIPLDRFGGLDLDNVAQLVFTTRNPDGNGDPVVEGQSTLFVDNIYFY
jgi:hypothetical protein